MYRACTRDPSHGGAGARVQQGAPGQHARPRGGATVTTFLAGTARYTAISRALTLNRGQFE